MDTTTASGELPFHVFGALAQYERALTRERIVAGQAALPNECVPRFAFDSDSGGQPLPTPTG